MTRKGLDLQVIVTEINMCLTLLFPPNMFMCASVVQFDQGAENLKFWVGGMPVTVLHNTKTGEIKNLPSQHMPLGILKEDEFDSSIEEIKMSDVERLYMCSVVIVESKNDNDHEYGVDRLISKLAENHDDVFEVIFNDVDAYA